MTNHDTLAERLHDAIAAVCPIDGVHIESISPWTAGFTAAQTASLEEQNAAMTALLQFDLTEAGFSVWANAKIKAQAKALVRSWSPAELAQRSAQLVVFQAIVHTRLTLNALIERIESGQGSLPAKLPIRSWDEVVASVESVIDAQAGS